MIGEYLLVLWLLLLLCFCCWGCLWLFGLLSFCPTICESNPKKSCVFPSNSPLAHSAVSIGTTISLYTVRLHVWSMEKCIERVVRTYMTYEVILMVIGLNELTVFIFVYIWTLLKDPVGTLPRLLFVCCFYTVCYTCTQFDVFLFYYTTLHVLLLSHIKIMRKTHFPLLQFHYYNGLDQRHHLSVFTDDLIHTFVVGILADWL